MSTSSTPQGAYEEAASIDHIRGLIAEARGDIPERISVAERMRHECWAAENPEEVARLISNTRPRGAVDEMVPDCDWSKVAGWRSCQAALRQLCNELRRPAPYYEIQTRDFTVVRMVHRKAQQCSIRSGPIIHRPHIAREDGASEMIRLLLEISSKHLDDYNYDLLEESLAVNRDLE
ncbi:hypothetical protein AHAS_Ahas15G0198900 [Arachis hypogaea]